MENKTNVSKWVERNQTTFRETAIQKSFHTLEGIVKTFNRKRHLERCEILDSDV